LILISVNLGSLLVTGGYDRQVLIWDVDNMVLKLKLQVSVNIVEFTLKSHCISAKNIDQFEFFLLFKK